MTFFHSGFYITTFMCFCYMYSVCDMCFATNHELAYTPLKYLFCLILW